MAEKSFLLRRFTFLDFRNLLIRADPVFTSSLSLSLAVNSAKALGSTSGNTTANLFATPTATTAIPSGSDLLMGPAGGSTSLMATGNTHHLFDSAPPIQNDPFAESSLGLTKLIDNAGNESHPVGGRGGSIMRRTAATAMLLLVVFFNATAGGSGRGAKVAAVSEEDMAAETSLGWSPEEAATFKAAAAAAAAAEDRGPVGPWQALLS